MNSTTIPRLLGCCFALCLAVSAAHAADPSAEGDGDFSLTIGNRFWVGGMSYDNKLISNGSGQLDSRLRWSDVQTLSNETTFRVTHQRSGIFLKGFAGIGLNRRGSLDDEDYAYNFQTLDAPPFTGKFFDTYSRGGGGSGLYGAVDLGIPLPLPKAWPVQVSGLVGGFAQRQSIIAKGTRCNPDDAQNLLCGPPGSVLVPFDRKSVGFATTLYGVRVGLEGVVRVSERLSWRNEAAYVFAGRFKLEDSHYLRVSGSPDPDNNLGPTPNIVSDGNRLEGFQLETEVSWAFTSRLSVNASARYWRFDSGRAGTVFFAQLPADQQERGQQHDRNRIDQYGVTLGVTYRF